MCAQKKQATQHAVIVPDNLKLNILMSYYTENNHENALVTNIYKNIFILRYFNLSTILFSTPRTYEYPEAESTK